MLNELEKLIIQEVYQFHQKEFKQGVNFSFSDIIILKREYTGVGIYVSMKSKNEDLKLLQGITMALSSPSIIFLDTLNHPISYELNFDNTGEINLLEIVSNGGENWNGKYNRIKIERNNS